jgi:hypothetical protein
VCWVCWCAGCARCATVIGLHFPSPHIGSHTDVDASGGGHLNVRSPAHTPSRPSPSTRETQPHNIVDSPAPPVKLLWTIPPAPTHTHREPVQTTPEKYDCPPLYITLFRSQGTYQLPTGRAPRSLASTLTAPKGGQASLVYIIRSNFPFLLTLRKRGKVVIAFD